MAKLRRAEAADDVAASSGAALRPMFPGTADAGLATYLVAEAADMEAAQRLMERLRESPHVEAAYIKPESALPGKEA